jgi:predicted transcriptional regulator
MDESAQLTAQIVAAYLERNPIAVADLPSFIGKVHQTLSSLVSPSKEEPAKAPKLTPAQIRRSINPNYLISFEDGRRYKTLRRHLSVRGLTPETYRAKWGLPDSYPTVAASYSERRSALAKSIGLGAKPASAAPAKRLRRAPASNTGS